ncbi:hypothetical protein Cgig2_027199 [Carnegiea gigantea]|uniref:Uncharacterized protein n=1 Tax=Carnegiea gigantea TaxID=171969 RepID=A0A9Q1KTM3_9CARY|nr:hypothetical protein Cgig2_027199 [Carnegiea gigantea]
MASVRLAPSSGLREFSSNAVDRLPEEMNGMKIRDDKVGYFSLVSGCMVLICLLSVADWIFKYFRTWYQQLLFGNGTETRRIIVTTIGGRNGQPKPLVTWHSMSFNMDHLELCFWRYKNRELQIIRLLDYPNVVCLNHCFFSTTDKDQLYLNLVLEYVSETIHQAIKHYNKMSQRVPLMYVKLYTYQVLGTPTREEIKCMNSNYTEFKFPQIKAHPWHNIFLKRMPSEAVDLVSRLLQYSLNYDSEK